MDHSTPGTDKWKIRLTCIGNTMKRLNTDSLKWPVNQLSNTLDASTPLGRRAFPFQHLRADADSAPRGRARPVIGQRSR